MFILKAGLQKKCVSVLARNKDKLIEQGILLQPVLIGKVVVIILITKQGDS